MDILKVRYAEYGRGSKPLVFEIDTADLTRAEVAELQFMVDLCNIVQDKKPYIRPATGEPGLFLIVETEQSIHAAHFIGNPPEEVKELSRLLKECLHKVCLRLPKSA